MQMAEVGGVVFDIDHFAVHDGPGIRSVVYFKGCPLRCLWCHSPESLKKEPEPVYIKSKCKSCTECAGENCPFEARKICGRYITASELINELLPQRTFYESSGGGVTISGGEPLFQPEFAIAVLHKLRSENIHTIIETTMMCDPGVINEIAALTDMFYCDVKIIDAAKHKQYTGHDNNIILSNIKLLANLKGHSSIVIRIPLIPGYTDTQEDISEIYRFAQDASLSDINLLPYNPSAPAKYEWLSKTYPLGNLARQNIQQLDDLLSAAPKGLNVKII